MFEGGVPQPWRDILVATLAVLGACLAAPAEAQQRLTPGVQPQLQPIDPPAPIAPVARGTIPAPEPEVTSIALNKARLVTLAQPVRDVVVANPAVASVIVQTPRTVYLVGKSLGETNVFFMGASGEVLLHTLVNVHIDLASARRSLEEVLPSTKIELEAVNNTIVLKGNAASAKESADAALVAQRFVEKPENVINMLRILSDMQILLQVKVAEVQRNVVKNLAAATSFNRTLLNDRSIRFTTSGGSAFSQAVSGSLVLNYMGLTNMNFTALESQGLVKTLAEPVLTAISGETANFLAGGEYPAPSGIDSNGNLIIQFREFGVGLSFTPVILSDNRISLRISTEVSRLAQENRLDLPFNNTTVPVLGLTVRRAASTVNLPSGGSLMIGGLIQNDEFNNVSGIPGLKDIPVLGALFRSQQFQRNETELVVMLQAFQVRAVDPGQVLALPTDGFVPASDFDIYFMGRLHKHYSKGSPLDQIPKLQGPYGYIME